MNEIINSSGVPYYWRAAVQQYMGKWCERLQLLEIFRNKLSEEEKNKLDQTEDVYSVIAKTIEADREQFIDPVYYYEQAVKNYQLAREMHFEGQAYQSLLADMYFLEDDFSDNLLHYRTSLERFFFNSGDFDIKIDKLRKKLYSKSGKSKLDSSVITWDDFKNITNKNPQD